MILYRHADPRFPFLWESREQPSARWHDAGEGPAHYFADTPDGAWAEFLRHEEITEPAELENIRRALWAVEIPDRVSPAKPNLSNDAMTGGTDSYEMCQAEARSMRLRGIMALLAPSAALLPGAAAGWIVDGGLRRGRERDGVVMVLFGACPDLTGWAAAMLGRPRSDLLAYVRRL